MIELFGDYRIKVDTQEYTFGTVKNDKKGDRIFSAIGYYGTLKQALEGARKYLIRLELSVKGEISLKDAIKVIEAYNKDFDELIRGVE